MNAVVIEGSARVAMIVQLRSTVISRFVMMDIDVKQTVEFYISEHWDGRSKQMVRGKKKRPESHTFLKYKLSKSK